MKGDNGQVRGGGGGGGGEVNKDKGSKIMTMKGVKDKK